MSRDLDAVLETEIEKPHLNPFFAIFIDLPDPVRVWTGAGVIEFEDADGILRQWDSGLNASGYPIGSLESIGESSDGSATGIRATLFGVPEQFRDSISEQAVRGADFHIYVGAVNETFQTVEAVQLLSRYRLDDFRPIDSGDTIMVEVSGESRAIDQRRPSVKRFTDEDQQRRHPGDLFFQFVPQMTEIPILWAAVDQVVSPVNSGGIGGAPRGGFGGDRF